MAAKPRILNSSKDMIWSLVPLIALCVFIAVVSQNCSVGLSGRADEDRTPPFEISAALRADAATLGFPIRHPAAPASWKPNSGSTQPVGGSMASNVGWITDHGAYLQLTQSAAKEEDLVVFLSHNGSTNDDTTLLGDGTRPIGGHNWVAYRAENQNKAWITDLGDVRIAIVSKGPDADMTTLAQATLAAQPLPKK